MATTAFFPHLTAPFGILGLTAYEIGAELDPDDADRIVDWRLMVNGLPVRCDGPIADVVNGLINELGLDAFGWRNEMTSRRDAFGEAQAEVGVGL